MKVARASLRVSLFGGGTDLPSYYEQEGSTIVSFALDLSIYVSLNRRPTGGCRLSYSEVEEVERFIHVKHSLVRVAAEHWKFTEPGTITIVGDLPKGTGLGSSSALTVALKEISTCGHKSTISPFGLEHIVNSGVGQQDFLPAIHGGLRKYTIDTSGKVATYEHDPLKADLIERYGVLLYTGISRPSAQILSNWVQERAVLHDIQDIAEDYADIPWTLDSLSAAMRESWRIKSSIDGVCSYEISEQYSAARRAGVLGGKLCGAGAGGCWFFLTEDRSRLVNALGLPAIPFSVSEKGHEMIEI